MEKCDKKELIIEAALELVAEHGFHGAPMAMIADKAGVGAGTIYRYFAGKDDLITAIHGCLMQRFTKALMQDYPEKGSVRERFMHIGQVLVRYLIDRPMELKFFEQFHNSPYGVAHRREKLFGKSEKDIICELFEEALQQEIVKEFELPILFALMFGPLIDVCRDHTLGFVTLDDGTIEQVVAACWHAVRR